MIPCQAAASRAQGSGRPVNRRVGCGQHGWLGATAKVREEPLCKKEGHGGHEKARCHRGRRPEACTNRPFDEPPGQRSDEHRQEGRHDGANR